MSKLTASAERMQPIYEAALELWWSSITHADDRPECATESLSTLANACTAELDRRHAEGLPIPKHHAVGHRAEGSR